MGVAKFYGRWVKQNFPDAIKNNLPHGNDIFLDTLEFDMGGLIHQCAAAVYSYGDGYEKFRRRRVEEQLMTKNGRQMLEQSFYQTVSDEIIRITTALIKETNYSYKRINNLVIAMDGVAVFAKIAQQRSRRFGSSLSKTESQGDIESHAENKNFHVPPPAGFDTNAMTPATDLMRGFDNYMKVWISTPQATSLYQNRVIYSSTQERGEGEHKIFSFRRQELYGTRDEKGIIAIYGLDADLIMLNAINPDKNVFLIREKNKHTQRNEGNETHGAVLNIDEYRKGLVKLMTGLENIDDMVETTMYNYVRDFTLMCFLVGNDFLPHIMCLINIENSIDILIEIYRETIYNNKEEHKNIFKPLKGHLTKEDASIVWKNFAIFLESLKNEEAPLLAEIGKSFKTDEKLTGNYDTSGKYFFNPRMLKESLTLKHFPQKERREAYSKYILDFEKFRTLWYAYSLGPKTQEMMNFVRKYKIEPFSLYEVEQMCRLYLQGLQWNLMYYTLGMTNVSRTWYYIHTQTPTIHDIVSVLTTLIQLNATPSTVDLEFRHDGPNFGPVHQLLSVMPQKSKELINKHYSRLLTSSFDYLGKLSYICPEKFTFDYESATVEHQRLCILPVVDPFQVVKQVSRVKKPTTTVDYKYLGRDEDDTIILQSNHTDSIKFHKKTFPSSFEGSFSSRGRGGESSYRGRGGESSYRGREEESQERNYRGRGRGGESSYRGRGRGGQEGSSYRGRGGQEGSSYRGRGGQEGSYRGRGRGGRNQNNDSE